MVSNTSYPLFNSHRWHLISSNSTEYSMQSLLTNVYPNSSLSLIKKFG